MPAFDSEIEQLLEEGGVLRPSWGPKKIVANGRMNGIELVRCTRVFDDAKRFNPSFDPSVTTVLEADTVILAIGQSTDLSLENARDEEELIKQGWTRQFLASGSRLEEARASYASIGLEVRLEPAQAKDLACSECQPPQPSATVEGWYVIYTRPKHGAESTRNEMDELW